MKIAAGATESWQENDAGKGMKCTSILFRSDNISWPKNAIHVTTFRNKFEEMRKEGLLILAKKGKVDAVIEVSSRVPAIFQLGFQFTEVMLSKWKIDLPMKDKKHRLICYSARVSISWDLIPQNNFNDHWRLNRGCISMRVFLLKLYLK